jgi:hypothetical protein
VWTAPELDWLNEYYPGLRQTAPGVLEGPLSFQMIHLAGVHYLQPDSEFVARHLSDGIYICDTYQVKIIFRDGWAWPIVYEVGGRIRETAKHYGKQIIDMHMYSSGCLCLASTMALDRAFQAGFSLPVYIDEFVVPYLFAQSYYAAEQIWLWGELRHGYLGLLDWLGMLDDYDDDDIRHTIESINSLPDKANRTKGKEIIGKRCRGHKPCPCESGKQCRYCCPQVQLAISRIRGMLNRQTRVLDH